MAARDEIIGFCNVFLQASTYDDYGPNGMQVPGSEDVQRVVSGVSANRRLLERAAATEANLVVVHHGLFWGSGIGPLSKQLAARLRVLLGGGITLAAYHLPLDGHAEIGNNVLVCRELGFEPEPEAFAVAGGRAIGAIGRRDLGVGLSELTQLVAERTRREPLVFEGGPPEIRSIGVVTGSGAKQIEEAAELGLDALISGEASEQARADCEECGIHFLAAGHHATEVYGVRRLGELISERFGLEHEFIDVPNPV